MNPKPLCIASSLAAFMIACTAEGGLACYKERENNGKTIIK